MVSLKWFIKSSSLISWDGFHNHNQGRRVEGSKGKERRYGVRKGGGKKGEDRREEERRGERGEERRGKEG